MLKNIIKKPGFWVAAAALTVIILQSLGIRLADGYISEIISGICAALVAIGLMTTKEKKDIEDAVDSAGKRGKEEEGGQAKKPVEKDGE